MIFQLEDRLFKPLEQPRGGVVFHEMSVQYQRLARLSALSVASSLCMLLRAKRGSGKACAS
jgi:hypothetical protein